MILVEIDKKSGQRAGDWIVRNGAGGEILSRHRTKKAAMEKARRAASRRSTQLRAQGIDGQWRQVASYK